MNDTVFKIEDQNHSERTNAIWSLAFCIHSKNREIVM